MAGGASSSSGGCSARAGALGDPRRGLLLGETLQAGAEREILEETGDRHPRRRAPFTCDSFEKDGAGRIRFHYVIVDVTADYVSGDVKGADDALEARWVSPAEIRELPVTKTTLKLLQQIGFISPVFPGKEVMS